MVSCFGHEKSVELCLFLTTGLPRPPNPKNVIPRLYRRSRLILDLEVSEESKVVSLWSRFSFKSLLFYVNVLFLLHDLCVLMGAKIVKR